MTNAVDASAATDATMSKPKPRSSAGPVLMAIAAMALIGYAAWQIAGGVTSGDVDGRDFVLYRDVTARWIAGGPFYQPWQLAGPYDVGQPYGAVLYPPVAISLFAPFTVLPAFLWWAIPLGLIAVIVIRLHPAPWSWPLLALCVAWPPTLVKLATGNPVMWSTAALALGVVYAGPAVFVLLKPSLFPFAFFGARHRRWWLALLIFAVACIPFGSMWVDWSRVVLDGRGGGLLYSWQEAPLLLIPIVAWIGRRQAESVPVD
jgi:hypothetical protein